MSDSLLGRVDRYYSAKLAEHGANAQGVDWRDAESQQLRFVQLLRVAEHAPELDLVDYGCGYGALVDVLAADGRPFRYVGYDVSAAMIAEARRRHGDDERVSFVEREDELAPAAYVVASGVLNVRLDVPDEEWRAHALATIERLDALSSRGFAFNALTSYSDVDKMRPDLWYADPRELFDLCKRRYSRHVALLHDYGLWEFTLLVRKDV
jgi:SAM-dependent methyltransferase